MIVQRFLMEMKNLVRAHCRYRPMLGASCCFEPACSCQLRSGNALERSTWRRSGGWPGRDADARWSLVPWRARPGPLSQAPAPVFPADAASNHFDKETPMNDIRRTIVGSRFSMVCCGTNGSCTTATRLFFPSGAPSDPARRCGRLLLRHTTRAATGDGNRPRRRAGQRRPAGLTVRPRAIEVSTDVLKLTSIPRAARWCASGVPKHAD